ncbi:MAG: hypothetical protein WBS22_03090 [Methylocystis sp.]
MKHGLRVLAGLAFAAAVTAVSVPANATTVATIVGAYDKDAYDTPELDITNSSGGTLTNLQLLLQGYQGLNNGKSQIVALPDIANGATYDAVWGFIPGAPSGTTPGNLTAYDYDDEWGNTPSGYTNPLCGVAPGTTPSLCSVVGNFKVTLTGTISGGVYNGSPVYSVFSPNNNYTGGFVGWEGLDPTGLSETTYDSHSGAFNGTMAIIQIGTVPAPGPVPGAGFAGLAALALAGLYARARRA